MGDGGGRKSSHWIDGPNELSEAAAAYFGTADRSQALVLDFVLGLAPVLSVVDFGTGRGAWLKAALRRGIEDIRGYDIPEIAVEARQFPAECFVAADLGRPIDPGRRFDLAISTEVAEHIPMQGAAAFVGNLARASDLVLFSAALPYQGGASHVNEHWVEYWAKLFAAEGFACFDLIRPRFWHEAAIRSYYRQNLLIFARGDAAGALQASGHAPTDLPLSLVHPEQYLKAVNRPLPPEMARLGADVAQFYDCVTLSPADVDARPTRHAYGADRVGWGALRRWLRRDD